MMHTWHFYYKIVQVGDSAVVSVTLAWTAEGQFGWRTTWPWSKQRMGNMLFTALNALEKLRLICEHLNVATSVFWACANVGSILPATHLKTWDVDLIKWRIMTYYYASYELSWHDMDSDPTNMSFMIMNNCVMYPSYYYGNYTIIMIT